MNGPINGWDLSQKNELAYYQPKIVQYQTFGTKDYFWPIKDSEVTVNHKLVQNLGW